MPAGMQFTKTSASQDLHFVAGKLKRLTLRCDWGPQYIADAWINEVKWLGISLSPSYVGELQCTEF